MQVRAKLWVCGLVSFCVGVAVTTAAFYRVFSDNARFVSASIYLGAASEGQYDAKVLQMLRDGRTDNARDALEHWLDSQLITLSYYEVSTPPANRDPVVYESLHAIAQYRDAYPRPGGDSPAEATIARALEMGRQHAKAAP